MASRLGDRLNAARATQFVGRANELDMLLEALRAPQLPFCVLYVHGPGGVGKTTLLRQFRSACQQHGVPTAFLDASEIEPSPDAFVQALRVAMNLPPADAPLQVLGAQAGRYVVFVDTCEALMPLDHWLRDQFLPQISDQVLIVLGGRQPPSLAWRVDPGWQEIVRVLPLRNLSPDESRQYLVQRGLPADQHSAILQFTYGHPLALSLVADVFAQRRDVRFQPEIAPDVIKMLVEQLIQKVPGPAHRTALEACALARVMTEALLAHMLGLPDIHDLFEWLRSLSFVEGGARGLAPHDLAREALIADLRWRNPDWYAELHRRARAYYASALQRTHGAQQQRVMFDYVFLHRDNPLVRPFLEWQESGSGISDRLRPDDIPALIEMAARHEGAASARLVAHWIACQPHNVTVYRDAGQRPAGFLVIVELQAASADDLRSDPATDAAWRFLRRHAPLRGGERATIFRFWMARDTYQAVSAVQSLIFVNIAQYYMNTPGLAYSFFACAAPEFWQPAFAYMDLLPLPDVAFAIDGRRYGVFGHDWRVRPPLAWLDLLAERELATAPLEIAPPATVPLLVLSQPEFETAVREALHNLHRPDAHRNNPLLRSRLVLELIEPQAGERDRIAALQQALRQTIESLQATPREAKLYRALYHTYLHPAPTQEQAAELLDLPFSTYRRHLKSGVDQVVAALWERELHGIHEVSSN
jgi:hypothetical protein